MATQPETLKFGAEWIRKLSDCTLPTQKVSTRSSGNKMHDIVSSNSEVSSGNVFVSSISRRSALSNEGVSDVWDPVIVSASDSGEGRDAVACRSSRTKDDDIKMAQSRGLQFCPPHPQPSSSSNNSNNNGLSHDPSRLTQVNPGLNACLVWPSKSTNASTSNQSLRRKPVSTSAQQTVGLSPNGISSFKWKSATGVCMQPNLSDNNSTVFDSSGVPLQMFCGSKTLDSSEQGAHGNNSTVSITEHESPHDSVATGKSSTDGASLDSQVPETQSAQQTERHSPIDLSFVTPVSKTLSAMQTKRAVSAYYGIQSSCQKRFSDTDTSGNLLWEQQRHWSKSVPQRLHGLEPGSTDALSSSLVGLVSHNVGRRLTDNSGCDGFAESLSSLNPSCLNDTLSFQPGAPQNVTTSDSYAALHESRGFHRPDGADRPDEHMWLYEDPQGRTQGTFSDAQMHEWLLAGIYFTPTLRIRRKCDDAFSTLADYTRLFGRVPFVPSFRVPPIRGGITPQLLGITTDNSIQLPSTDISASPDPLQSRITGSKSGSDVSATAAGLPLAAFYASTTSGASFPGSVESTNTSTMGQSVFDAHQSACMRPPDRSTYLVGSIPIEEGRGAAHLTTAGSICVNSALSQLHGRNVGASLPLLTHSFGGLDLGSGAVPTENETQVASTTSHSITTDSTLMTLASLISMNPVLASLALPFAGQGVTANNSTTDCASTTAAISPGFLAALAQYLKVQPHSSGHQSVSPMQQLAETAQLAAQLAAMVGAHSPDQTPMQPAQALALAQLVMSQATQSSEQHWVSLSKQDSTVTDPATESNAPDPLGRRVDRPLVEDPARNRTHASQEPIGSESARVNSHSAWPVGLGIDSAGNRAPCTTDGRVVGKCAFDPVPQMTYENERCQDSTLCTSGSGAAHLALRTQNKGQSKVNNQRINASVSSSKSHNGLSSNLSRDTLGCGSHSSCAASTNNKAIPTSTNLRWSESSDITEHKKKDDSACTTDQDIGSKSNSSGKQPLNQWVTKVKHIPGKTSAHLSNDSITIRTDTSPQQIIGKGTSRININQSKPTSHGTSSNGPVQSPVKSAASSHGKTNPILNTNPMTSTTEHQPSSYRTMSTAATVDSDGTAEYELEQLTQWCQSRLSSFPMREKVDIPTVVELLATLDAPYEVERMVQTFLGESARTSQFVKDFLDHRRPFWQLHRERRDRENQVKSNSKSQSGGHHAHSSTSRLGEKKKRGQTQALSTRPNQSSGRCSASGWQKISVSAHSNTSDPTQDNEWHHIKPKSNHNRKGKKDKAS